VQADGGWFVVSAEDSRRRAGCLMTKRSPHQRHVCGQLDTVPLFVGHSPTISFPDLDRTSIFVVRQRGVAEELPDVPHFIPVPRAETSPTNITQGTKWNLSLVTVEP
jgi:hypothetical protein